MRDINVRSYIKGCVNFFISCFSQFFSGIFSSIGDSTAVKLTQRFFYSLNNETKFGSYLTLIARPKKIDHMVGQFDIRDGENKIAIVVQGSIIQVNNFTFETIRLYKMMFADARIIFSTWEGENQRVLSELERLGVIIIQSNKPEHSGFLNFNYQKISTEAGLKKARELGVTEVLKTRSDQRIYSKYALSYMSALLTLHPIGCNISKARGRILIMDTTTLVRVPLHICDMLQFGYLVDLEKFWLSAEIQNFSIDRKRFEEEFENKRLVEKAIESKLINPEIWLGRNYAEYIFGALDKNYEVTYLKLLKDVLCVINKSEIDLFWPKYHAIESYKYYTKKEDKEIFDNALWNIILNSKSKSILKYDSGSLF